MDTAIIPADEAGIALGAALLREGRLVAFPTETVYGLGANGLDSGAVRAIFEAKGRPADNPLILHIAHNDALDALVREVPETARVLMAHFWPGALTLILPRAACVPDIVTGGLDTVAVRMPSHPVARALIERAGCPVAAPSANRSGRPSPTRAGHVFADMDGRIPLILDGGACAVGLESTVLDLTGVRPVLLRPGGVTPEQLLPYLPDLHLDAAISRPMAEGEKPRSPGTKYRHYAPTASLSIVVGAPELAARAMAGLYDRAETEGSRAALLVTRQLGALMGDRRCYVLGEAGDSAGMAAALFDSLRALDADNIQVAYAQDFHAGGMGLALMNRLSRAAAFQRLDAATVIAELAAASKE